MKQMMFFLVSILCLQSWGSSSVPFIRDLKSELIHADFLQVTDKTKNEWIQSLKDEASSLDQAREIVNRALGKNHDFKNFSFTRDKGDPGPKSHDLLPVHGEKINLNSQHAIFDLRTYVENRIGVATLEYLQSKRAKTLVLGSEPRQLQRDLSQILLFGTYHVSPIPSLYEQWGIHRYLVESASSKNPYYYVIIVPPSLQYVRHYTTMINSGSPESQAEGLLSQSAQGSLKRLLRQQSGILKSDYGDVDVVFFGYERHWLSQMALDSSPWQLIQNVVLTLEPNLTVNLIEAQHKATGRLLKMASIGPKNTIWGELAPMYFEALLALNPQVVFFLGSAGSLDPLTRPYVISAPREFYSLKGKVRIENFVLNHAYQDALDGQMSDSRHAITYSPIQQTKKYVKSLVKQHIKSIDVEQVLVSEMIADKNRSRGTPILFGAINVVTDIPGSILAPDGAEVSHNLDVLNHRAKNEAKDKAASVALEALDAWILKRHGALGTAQSCQSLLLRQGDGH